MITTLAGSPDCDPPGGPTAGGYAEGTGAAASFKAPWGLVMSPDGATVYVADSGNQVIRKVSIATGATSLLAGSPGLSGTADGTATGRFTDLGDITISPAGAHLYVADGRAIRRVDVTNGDIMTIAGSVTAAAAEVDNAVGTTARFGSVSGPSTDGATLWVGDGGNNRIRAVALSGSFPVSTEAGSGSPGSQDGTGTGAVMDDPRGLSLAPDGQVYFVDAASSVIRRFDPSSKSVVTRAGTPFSPGSVDGFGATARFMSPRAMTIEGIHWAISDNTGAKIRGELPPLPSGASPEGGTPTGPGPGGGASVLSAPKLTLAAKSAQRVLRQGGVLVTGRCDKACTLTATGTVSYPGSARSFALRRASRRLAGAGRATLKLRLSAKATRALRRALKRRKRVTARVTVRATSPAGASAPVRRSIRVRR